MSDSGDSIDLRRALRQQLRALAAAGVQHAPLARPAAATPATPREEAAPHERAAPREVAASREEPAPTPVEAPAPPPAPPATESEPMAKSSASVDTVPAQAKVEKAKAAAGDDAASQLEVLADEVAGCTLCRELAETRTQTVFGVGTPQPRLVFMGEAPGADEDRTGEPFVGRAGKLLTKIIEACGLQRDEVYILNTLKCRPPENRNPTSEEATNCRPYFERQLQILQPEFIVCLGAVAAQNLLETKQFIGKLRGEFHNYKGAKVMATYHPSYLLRNPPAKRQVWEDMQMLLKEMGLPIPKQK